MSGSSGVRRFLATFGFARAADELPLPREDRWLNPPFLEEGAERRLDWADERPDTVDLSAAIDSSFCRSIILLLSIDVEFLGVFDVALALSAFPELLGVSEARASFVNVNGKGVRSPPPG